MTDTDPSYDSLLVVSFGGPEGPDDVIPFLENVLRGKNVPRERMMEVAEHYYSFGGVSPINDQCRELIAALRSKMDERGIELPIYWGNRNWSPMLADTLGQMKADGRKRALAYFTSVFSSYSGCRQYRENIAEARAAVGDGAPEIDKLRMGFNHPGFIDTMAENVRGAIAALPSGGKGVTLLFTAHSIPNAMAENCDYEKQLHEASRLVAESAGVEDWSVVYQSRSGPPQQPWLEPDICDAISQRHASGDIERLVIAPIGFVSDHIEVLYDLDDEAAKHCQQLGIPMQRASTVGVHESFLEMICELIEERLGRRDEKRALGTLGPWHDVCPADCCQYTPRRPPAGVGHSAGRPGSASSGRPSNPSEPPGER